TAFAPPAISLATCLSCAGLWQSTTRSLPRATARFESTASPPSSFASARARPDPESEHSTASPHPRTSAPAILPAPMLPTRIVRTVTGGKGRGGGFDARGTLALIKEALLDEPGPLFGRNLDVVRGQQEHLVGDPLHAAVERVRQPTREV